MIRKIKGTEKQKKIYIRKCYNNKGIFEELDLIQISDLNNIRKENYYIKKNKNGFYIYLGQKTNFVLNQRVLLNNLDKSQ